MTILLCLLVGIAAGAAGAAAWMRPRLAAQRLAAETLRAQLDQAASASVHLADLQSQVSVLRHDLRGILSPALLTADRLSTSTDPAIRKAGEIVVRTVERATARLAETKLGQDLSKTVRE
jgi:hypothetical protein